MLAVGACGTALLALQASDADAVGLPATFPRTIATIGSAQGVRVARFEVATRAAGARVRVKVRVAAATISGHARAFDLAVAPCTGGATATSPLCRPRVTVRLRIGARSGVVTRAVLVPRPAARRDALRVTLNAAGAKPVWRPENVGGGGGTGEILLNGGAWRFQPGTWWGVVARPPAGVALDRISFNSRTYAWTGTADAETVVSTRIGYHGAAPRWDFTNTMGAGRPFAFRRTPSTPARDERAAPRALDFTAQRGADQLFAVSVPMPAWDGR
jgi:hypothetical protein